MVDGPEKSARANRAGILHATLSLRIGFFEIWRGGSGTGRVQRVLFRFQTNLPKQYFQHKLASSVILLDMVSPHQGFDPKKFGK
jgi:hypothetical protein